MTPSPSSRPAWSVNDTSCVAAPAAEQEHYEPPRSRLQGVVLRSREEVRNGHASLLLEAGPLGQAQVPDDETRSAWARTATPTRRAARRRAIRSRLCAAPETSGR